MHLNEYRIMWLYVYFDLPTTTKKERKAYAQFRKALIQDGFVMQQYSIYIRHCPSLSHAITHARRVQKILPELGKISFLRVTDKQFGDIENFWGRKKVESKNPQVEQLLLFD